MGSFNPRAFLEFPKGSNTSQTTINGVTFNRTLLNKFGYQYYSNNTISNGSTCLLIFDHYQPHMVFDNGTWLNATSCYNPYYGIGTRGKGSIAFGAVFAITIMFTLVNLRKHGRLLVREEQRFRIIGRRWQWYWMSFIAACGMISCFTGVDVDRYYLQSIPIILQGFFFSLMYNGTLAAVWEATRHWGSWQERQIVDRDPHSLPQDDKRAKTEFYLPLIFYLFNWLNFFMVVPRSWTKIEMQRSPEQQALIAKPSATDIRHKIGAILAAVAFCVICFSLVHSMKHYKPLPSGTSSSFRTFMRFCPKKLFLVISVLAVRAAYDMGAAWIWDISVLKYDVNPVWPLALGYGTTLLILVIFEIAGYLEENEDKQILKQRRERGLAADAELGIVRKPSWWRRSLGDAHLSDDQRLRNLASEVPGGGQPRNDTSGFPSTNIEMRNMQNLRNRSKTRPPSDPFRDESPPAYEEGTRLDPRTRIEADNVSTMTGLSGATRVSDRAPTGNEPPQRIRSMLDV